MRKSKNKKKPFTDKKKVVVIFLMLLIVAVISDINRQDLIENGTIAREDLGGEDQSISLFLEVDELVEKEEYKIELPPTQPTKEEAESYFTKAIETIEQDFKEIREIVPYKSEYENGMVEAEWIFFPYGLIDEEGNIKSEKIEDSGAAINAQVELSCGSYETIYNFAFVLKPRKLTEKEYVMQQLQNQIESQINLEGSSILKLPTEVNGYDVLWSEKRELLTPQILALEIVVLFLLSFLLKKKQKEDEQKRISKMEREYPDIVNQLSLLLGAGMTTRQAWKRLATQYKYKRQSGMIEQKEVYEAILLMNRRLSEGESERVVYQEFSQEIPVICYRKLMRMLLGNIEKGTQDITSRLEEECRIAYEQRIQMAKKVGEEASTKMLLPLMLMLSLVMGMVMLPALIGFQL